MSDETANMVGDCDRCNAAHEAEPSHEGQWGEGPIWAVTCPVDGLTQWHTREGVRPAPAKRGWTWDA